MMNKSDKVVFSEPPPEYAYHLLRGALDLFGKCPRELDDGQYRQASARADKTFSLESLVLSTPEARDTVFSEARLDAAVVEVVSRYPDHKAFLKDLNSNGLDETTLRRALHRELQFDTVMDKVSSQDVLVSDFDVEVFYQSHRDRFIAPEKRTARHILITVNSAYQENTREAALDRIQQLALLLEQDAEKFPKLAQQHSECPTALQDGFLGNMPRGKLYPQLDVALFRLKKGEMSEVVESEAGFHLIRCEKIQLAQTLPLQRVEANIRHTLEQHCRRECQGAWLTQLKAGIPTQHGRGTSAEGSERYGVIK